MSIQRDTIPFGPGKVAIGADTLYSAGDINVNVITQFADVKSDQYGQGIKTIVDQTIEIAFRPQSLWSLIATVWPAAHLNPTIGSRVIGAAPGNLTIHGEDSSLLTVFAPGLVQLPSLSLGVDKAEFGEMKFVGVVDDAKSPGAADSLFTYAATGGTYGTPSAPDYLAAAEWSMAWNTDVLEGTLLESVTINPDMQVEPVKFGPRTVDFRRMGIQFGASVVAAHDLADLAALHGDDTTFLFGRRNTALGADLVLTSGLGHTITLKSAALEKSAMRYAMKEQRARNLDFRTSLLTGARVTLTAP
jgi:hypothetical protein